MFSVEYFCPNHQRFARKTSKISPTRGAAAPVALPARTPMHLPGWVTWIQKSLSLISLKSTPHISCPSGFYFDKSGVQTTTIISSGVAFRQTPLMFQDSDFEIFNCSFQDTSTALRIGPLHDPVTRYKIKYTGEQVAQWDFQTKAGQGGLVRVALFWKSHCATCSPVYLILYHVTGSCKGPIHSR